MSIVRIENLWVLGLTATLLSTSASAAPTTDAPASEPAILTKQKQQVLDSLQRMRQEAPKAWSPELEKSLLADWKRFAHGHLNPLDESKPHAVFDGMPQARHYRDYLGTYTGVHEITGKPDLSIRIKHDAHGRYILEDLGQSFQFPESPLATIDGTLELQFGGVLWGEDAKGKPFLMAARLAQVDGRLLFRAWPDNGWDSEVRYVLQRVDE